MVKMKAVVAGLVSVMGLAGGAIQSAQAEDVGHAVVENNLREPNGKLVDRQEGVAHPDERVEGGFMTTAAGNCRLHTWAVGQNGRGLGVQGGRFDCANPVGFRVQLRKDRKFLPDEVIGESWGYGNGAIRAYGVCKGRGTYLGETRSDTGNKKQGDRGVRC